MKLRENNGKYTNQEYLISKTIERNRQINNHTNHLFTYEINGIIYTIAWVYGNNDYTWFIYEGENEYTTKCGLAGIEVPFPRNQTVYLIYFESNKPGHGYGKIILDEFFSYLRSKGIIYVILIPSNLATEALYVKYGFTPVNEPGADYMYKQIMNIS